jgi:hypothetical protein
MILVNIHRNGEGVWLSLAGLADDGSFVDGLYDVAEDQEIYGSRVSALKDDTY